MKIVNTHPCKIGFSANAGKIVYDQNLSGSLFYFWCLENFRSEAINRKS